MVLIKNSKGRKIGSGYERMFGDRELGHLLSRVHSTVIRSGNELEQLIISASQKIDNIDKFLSKENPENGTYLVHKKAIKDSKLKVSTEPDFLVFKIDTNKKHCYIIELKDGDNFDTKKSQGEKDLLQNFQRDISSRLEYTTSIHICCFNQKNRDSIVKGFKYKITKQEALTGYELCQILKIDYQSIIQIRTNNQTENFDFFIKELLNIPSIRKKIQNILRI